MDMHSGWLVDSLVLFTSMGRRLGPFGRSNGGGLRQIANTNLTADPDRHTDLTGLALHGIQYRRVRTLGCLSWFNLMFYFSSSYLTSTVNTYALKI